MTIEEQISKMRQSIAQAIKMKGDRLDRILGVGRNCVANEYRNVYRP